MDVGSGADLPVPAIAWIATNREGKVEATRDRPELGSRRVDGDARPQAAFEEDTVTVAIVVTEDSRKRPAVANGSAGIAPRAISA